MWNHKLQRFLNSTSQAGKIGNSRLDVEIALEEMLKQYNLSNKDYYIVEWEIKND